MTYSNNAHRHYLPLVITGGEGLFDCHILRLLPYMQSCQQRSELPLERGSQFPEIPKAPFHPDINANFKARSFGKTNVVLRSFQPSWCSK